MRVSAAVLALAAAGAAAQPADPALCTSCHGPGGNSAQLAVPSIAGQPRTFLENQLVLIREGLRDVPVMAPVMKGLTDAQIVALAKHFSAQPVQPPGGTADAAKLREGAALSQRGLCGNCHGPGYRGQEQVPRLAGQQEAYLLATMKMYRDAPAPGRDTAMSSVLRGLSDAELATLSHYFAQAVGSL